MTEFNVNEIVGDSFEDMTIAEMALVQGAVDVDARSGVIAMTWVSLKAASAWSSAACAGAGVGGVLSLARC